MTTTKNDVIGGPKNPAGKYCGNELDYVLRFLDSEDKTNKAQPWSQRFEAAFAKTIGSTYAIAHNSGTSALHSSLAAAGVGPGDEVISPALTVVMDSYAAMHLGATPVFADVDRDTQNIDPEDVRRKITDRTKAIITVSLQGLPADVAPIMDMARARGIIVVEDCAQTLLARYKTGKYSGTIGHLGVYSFETKKHLSTGEGGMVVTDDEQLAERVRKFAGIGYKNLTAEAGRMSLLPSDFQDPYYERFDTLGLNYRMPEICAAVGLAQLERAEALVERRRQVAAMFRDAVAGCSWMIPQTIPPGYEHSYYTYSVRYLGEQSHGLKWKQFWSRYKEMGGDGFYGACRVPYLEPVFRVSDKAKKFRPADGTCPVAEEIQPQIMQFKTNYREMDVARRKTDILARLIDELGR
jgi:perosamine synthetase